MFINNLKIAFRHLHKQKLYSFINIIGFAIGISACILILLYVRHETSYDQYHPNADRIYRIYLSTSMNGQEETNARVSAPVAPTVKADYPEVEAAGRLCNFGYPVIRYEDKVFSEERWYAADAGIIDVFSIPFLAGDPEHALTQPNTVVLTQSMAAKYFGDENPIGKTLTADNQRDYRVTGVIADVPSNSHIHYDFLASMEGYKDRFNPQNWFDDQYFTYILLKEGSDPAELESKFYDMVIKYMGPLVEMIMGTSLESILENGARYDHVLQPITDIHLHSHLELEAEPNGDIRYVTIFSVIAAFILMIACINFMNLATARSSKRAREVGVRRTLGSNRSSLIYQFLSESIFLTFLAVLVAMLLVQLSLPLYNRLLGTDLHLHFFTDPRVIPSLALFAILIGILAGIYPALFLASFRPIKVLRSQSGLTNRKSRLRSGLVIFQFTISILLVAGAIIVNHQISFMQNKKLGFDKDQLVIIEKTDDLGSQLYPFTQTLQDYPDIIEVTNSQSLIGSEIGSDGYRREEGPLTDILTLAEIQADSKFAETYKLDLAQGRYFTTGREADIDACVINEALANYLGYDDPVGRRIFEISGGPDQHRPFTIIGVVEDFHFESPQHQIRPLIIRVLRDGQIGRYTTVRVRAHNIQKTLAFMKSEWKQQTSGQAFEYRFFDEHFAQLFKAEQQTRTLVSVFSALAICVACLGLFGMASFMTEQRTKEIGIRKTLGASVPNLFALLCREIVLHIFLATFIALPVSYYAMTQWLQNYPYRIHYDFLGFFSAGILALMIAILTVSNIALRAARANPVNSLKYE